MQQNTDIILSFTSLRVQNSIKSLTTASC